MPKNIANPWISIGREAHYKVSLPSDGSDLDGKFPSKPVGNPTRNEGADERSTRHCGRDPTLCICGDIGAEVIYVLLGSDTVTTTVSRAIVYVFSLWDSYMADIDEMSKPNSAPPIQEIA